jgi:hypothetical protein
MDDLVEKLARGFFRGGAVWDELTDEMRDADREEARGIIKSIKQAGFRIVRK